MDHVSLRIGNIELDITVQNDIDIVTVLETLLSPSQDKDTTPNLNDKRNNLIPDISPLLVHRLSIPTLHTLSHTTEVKAPAAHRTRGVSGRLIPLTNTRMTECVTTNQCAPSACVIAHRALHRFYHCILETLSHNHRLNYTFVYHHVINQLVRPSSVINTVEPHICMVPKHDRVIHLPKLCHGVVHDSC